MGNWVGRATSYIVFTALIPISSFCFQGVDCVSVSCKMVLLNGSNKISAAAW